MADSVGQIKLIEDTNYEAADIVDNTYAVVVAIPRYLYTPQFVSLIKSAIRFALAVNSILEIKHD